MEKASVQHGTRVHSVPTPLRVTCASSFAELSPLADEWDQFVERSGSDIYFTIDWLETWWKHYGGGRQLRCFAVYAGGRLVGALPFCVHTIWVGFLPVRVARFVGSDSTTPVLSPPVEPECAQEALDITLTRLFKNDLCDAVSLSPLSATSSIIDAVRRLCGSNDPFRLARDSVIGPHTLIPLPTTFDEYLRGLRKQQRSNYLRDLSQLCNRLHVTHEVVGASNAPQKFDGFAGMHTAQWAATGRLGHFGDWPASLAFNRELVMKLAAKDRVRFFVLTGNCEPLSIQYAFLLGRKCYWRLPARVMKADTERIGLGRIGLVKMIEMLIAEGIEEIEAGSGHYDYKVRHGGLELPLHSVVVHSAAKNDWKVRAMLLWSDLIGLFYYRIWFLKVAPRIPWLQRALWGSWIRTRL